MYVFNCMSVCAFSFLHFVVTATQYEPQRGRRAWSKHTKDIRVAVGCCFFDNIYITHTCKYMCIIIR